MGGEAGGWVVKWGSWTDVVSGFNYEIELLFFECGGHACWKVTSVPLSVGENE